MSETLKTQLESMADVLPIVDTSHFVLFQKTDTGPVAFLFERRDPADEDPILHMELAVRPDFQSRLYVSRKKRLVQQSSRTRYKFHFRRPRKDVALPAEAKCPKQAKWIKVVDKLYDKLRAHDSTAWEDLLGALLDVPPGSKGASLGKG